MGVEELRPFNDFNDITVFTADLNMQTVLGGDGAYIQVIDAGAGTQQLSVRTAAGNVRTVTVATGDEIGPIYFTDILLATTVARLRVYTQGQ
jgi:hypothetical protein